MRPMALTISNYRAFESVELNLEAVESAAIIGPNGAGKSTLCEAVLWAIYGEGRSSSVDGVVRLGADEASVDLVYAHNGNGYRIVRKRSRGRRSELQYMIADCEGGGEYDQDAFSWRPISGSSIRETQERIVRDLAMDEELFLASSCVMQGRSAGICEAGPAERKAVLYRILEDRLAKFGPLHEAAKQQVRALEETLAGCRAKRSELEAVIETQEAETASRQQAQDALDGLRVELEQIEAQLTAARDAETRRMAAIEQVAALSTRIRKLEQETRELSATIDRHKSIVVHNETLLADAARTRDLAYECDEIEAALLEMQALAERERETRRRYETLERELDAEGERLGREEARIERELELARERLVELSDQAALADTVPCVGTAYNADCKLLSAARMARSNIDSTNDRIEDLRCKATKVSTTIAANAARYVELDAIRAEIDDLGYDEQAHRELSRRVVPLRQARAKLPELEAAQARLEAAREALASAEAGLSRVDDHLIQAVAERRQLTDHVAALDEQDLPNLEHALQGLQTRIGCYVREIAIRDDRLARISWAESALEDLGAEIDGLDAQRAIYATLQRACGRDGIPALIIDAAVPQIEDQANEILASLSDGRMSLRFETQRQKTTGGIAETLDIIIADQVGERPYEDWSGGEKLRIDLAVRIALGRALAQRTGSRIEILILDEVCAPLDEAGEEALIDCINRLQDSFACILLITHRETLRDRLPQQIIVTKNAAGSHVSLG